MCDACVTPNVSVLKVGDRGLCASNAVSEVVARLFQTPTATLLLVAEGRVWVKGQYGLTATDSLQAAQGPLFYFYTSISFSSCVCMSLFPTALDCDAPPLVLNARCGQRTRPAQTTDFV